MAASHPDTLDDILNEVITERNKTVADLLPTPCLLRFSSRSGIERHALGRNVAAPASKQEGADASKHTEATHPDEQGIATILATSRKAPLIPSVLRMYYATSNTQGGSLDPVPWSTDPHPKVYLPRRLLAKLTRAEQLHNTADHDDGMLAQAKALVDEVEAYLLAQDQPWAGLGSHHCLHTGDYDFCSILLGFFITRHGPYGSKLLSQACCDHVSTRLLPDPPVRARYRIPRLPPGTIDTENHILMINGTHHLNHRYRHGLAKGAVPRALNAALEHHLIEVRDRGCWEFNARPYTVYYFLALLVLEEAGEPRISELCRQVMDALVFGFALGSDQLRRNDPFRRRPARTANPDLYDLPLSSLIAVWLCEHGEAPPELVELRQRNHGLHRGYGCYPACFRYCPPLVTCRLAWKYHFDSACQHMRGYYARLGHGDKSCPEVYTRTPDWLLCAGGATVDRHIGTRPIALMWTEGSAAKRSDLLRIEGKGAWKKWNMTGVIFNVAIAKGNCQVPSSYTEIAPSSPGLTWRGYRPKACPHALVLVHNAFPATVAAIVVLSNVHTEAAASGLLDQVNTSNGVLAKKGQLVVPQWDLHVWSNVATVDYDLGGKKKLWTITGVNGQPLDRSFQRWPLVDVHGDVLPTAVDIRSPSLAHVALDSAVSVV
eukprot:m.112348 g.112348  ORF g.112348 m.112348 type:complete len:659 (-) comp15407_c0_seq2:113-2089(-)